MKTSKGLGREAARARRVFGFVVRGALASLAISGCGMEVAPAEEESDPSADATAEVVIDGRCYADCASAASDPDRDGWGWENNASCLVVGSTVWSRGTPCASGGTSTGSSGSSGGGASSGFNIDGTCYPACVNAGGDGQGWGWENARTCVVRGSSAASRGSACTPGGASSGSSGAGTGSTTGSSSGTVGGGRCPTSLSCPSGMSCGCYLVSGLGANKVALRNAGASQYMLASAMMETERMDTNYAFGDNKTGDAFNAGVTKQNWGMMRQCHPAWRSLGASSYTTSAAMNSNRALDVQVYNACRSFFGTRWWAGHRNGSSGLNNPNTQDINRFKAAMDWTNQMLNGHLSDDVRFWVNVPAIERRSNR